MVLRGIQSNNKSERGIHLPRSLQFVEKPIPFIKLQPDFVHERGKRLEKADR